MVSGDSNKLSTNTKVEIRLHVYPDKIKMIRALLKQNVTVLGWSFLRKGWKKDGYYQCL